MRRWSIAVHWFESRAVLVHAERIRVNKSKEMPGSEMDKGEWMLDE